MKYIYVISVVSENTLQVLQRIAGIFSRHRLSIEHLTFFQTDEQQTFYYLVIHTDSKTIDRVIKQLQRIVELLEVKITSQVPLKQINFLTMRGE